MRSILSVNVCVSVFRFVVIRAKHSVNAARNRNLGNKKLHFFVALSNKNKTNKAHLFSFLGSTEATKAHDDAEKKSNDGDARRDNYRNHFVFIIIDRGIAAN